jgi:hypothetical protein
MGEAKRNTERRIRREKEKSTYIQRKLMKTLVQLGTLGV